MKEDKKVRDQHVYILLGIIGIVLSTTLINLLVGRQSAGKGDIVVPLVDVNWDVAADSFEREEMASDTLKYLPLNDTWETALKLSHRDDEHIVLAETIQKKDSKFTIKVVDKVKPTKPKVRDNVLDSFRHRSLVQRMACKHIWEVLDTQKTGSYEDLLTLHTKFYELDYSHFSSKSSKRRCRPPQRQFNSIFLLTKEVDLMVCLPPKCGTTNYQKAFAVLQQGRRKNGQFREPESLSAPQLYSIMKRVKPPFFTQEPLNLPVEHTMANVRNPFSRLHSAFNDKLRKDGKHKEWITSYLPAIQPFMDTFPTDNGDHHAASFNAFAAYVTANPSDVSNDWHWKTEFWHCSPCQFNYKYITHLENSTAEAEWLFKHFKVENKTHLAGEYQTLPGHTQARLPSQHYYNATPKDLIKRIYRHYYVDFIVFGFSPADVEKYVDAGSNSEYSPHPRSLQQSRLKAKSIKKLQKKGVQYNVCN